MKPNDEARGDHNQIAVLGWCAAIGVVAFATSMGWYALDPTRLDWIFLGGLDTSMQFVGWHMFRYEDWTWPLGATPSYGHPVGTSVALTDSIPVFALVFKLLSKLLAPDFQYLGFWLLLCFVMQGVFGVLLMRICTGSLVLQVLGATLFVLSPLLVHRATHAGLTAHWLLLASLAFYFTGKSGAVTLFRWLGLTAFAAATHAYLTAMVLALAFAAFLRDGLQQPSRLLKGTVLPGAAVVTTALFVWWVTGYLIVGQRGDLEASGFGILSMNILSPLMPMGMSALFGQGAFALADPSQFEGYAYFGAGTSFLMCVAALTTQVRWSAVRCWVQANLPLLLVAALLSAFALSPRVTLGARTVMQYDPSWWGPLAVFRASGRMFWPVYYALMFAALAAIATRFRWRSAVALMIVAVLLQAVDMSEAHRGSRRSHAAQMPVMPFQDAFWTAALPHYRHLVFHPTNMCTPRQGQAVDYRFLVLHAARAGATVNAGYAARYDVQKLSEYCATFAQDIHAGRVTDDQLWVTFPRFAPELMAASPQPLLCTLVDGHAACVTRTSYARWQSEFDIVRRSFVPEQELLAFRERLEVEYRVRLARPASPAVGSTAQRLHGLARYLAYRSRGCLHDEAVAKVIGDLKATPHTRVCAEHRLVPGPLPPQNETRAFVRQLASMITPAVRESTHVDEEGEAVWVQEYTAERLTGRSHEESTAIVINRIRSVAR